MKNQTLENLYSDLYHAFDFFNEKLFDGNLPDTILSYGTTEKEGVLGYFSSNRFKSVDGDERVHHISINAEEIGARSDRMVLSTLVHEMVHLYQTLWGNPGKNGYHNKEWVELMEVVGLIASQTGKKGGKQTGIQMDHYIKRNGPFDKAYKELKETGFKLKYKAVKRKKPKQTRAKTKYTSPSGDSVWGKPGLYIKCGVTDEQFVEA